MADRLKQIILIITLLITIVGGGFAVYKFVVHEKTQEARLTKLENDVSLLKAETNTEQNNGKMVTLIIWQSEIALHYILNLTIGGTNVAWQQVKQKMIMYISSKI